MIIFLSNFGPPLVLILAAITTVRLFVLWASGRTRLAVSPRRWLIGWGAVGFAVSAVLGLIAWRMDNDFVVSHFYWIWPFCLGLAALNGHPPTITVLLLLFILAIVNGLFYLLAALASLAFQVRKESKKTA